MKVSKVFGCVLGLHFGVIAVLLFQPGCQTNQPPTRTYSQGQTLNQAQTNTQGAINAQRQTVDQGRTYIPEQTFRSQVQGASRSGDPALIPARRADGEGGLDAAFNAGFEDDFAPGGNEFGEFDDVAPITPLPSGSGRGQMAGQMVDVAGASFETYTVKKGDSLWSISRRYNLPINELYEANGLNQQSVLRIGQQIQIPVEGSSAAINTVSPDTYQPTSFNQGSTDYTVKRGDTLSKIANQFDTSVRAIKAANGKTSDLIRVGESLVIPVGANASGPSSPSGASTSSPAPTSRVSATSAISASRTHTVKAGEFPATIARQYGMTTGELLALNGITDPRKLQVGQVLKVSGSGSAANVDSRTETVVSPSAATSSSVSTTRPAPAPRPAPAASSGPVEIRVIEADPLVEGEATQIQADELFEGAVEIPVIRLEE
jgi:LysM repeat protein